MTVRPAQNLWSIDQALVWCATRSIAVATEPGVLWYDLIAGWAGVGNRVVGWADAGRRDPPPGFPQVAEQGPVLDWSVIEAKFVTALSDGYLIARQTPAAMADFEGAAITFDEALVARITLAAGSVERPTFRVGDVMTAFPITPTTTGIEPPAPIDKPLTKPTSIEVERLYRERAQTLSRSSEAECQAFLRSINALSTRERARDLRKRFAPAAWTMPGVRSSK